MIKADYITLSTSNFYRNSLCGFTLLLMLILCAPAQAKMYKWVDENGVTQYTQNKPVQEDSVVIKAHSAPSNKPAQNTSQSRSHGKKDKTRKTISTQASLVARKKKKCAYIQKNLELLQQPLNMMTKRVKGKLVPINTTERSQLISQYQSTIKKHCH